MENKKLEKGEINKETKNNEWINRQSELWSRCSVTIKIK